MSGQPWEDRRGMFQRGKEVHEPARRPSQSGGVIEAVRRASLVEKPLSNDTASPPASPPSQRRRSSAASGGMFGNLAQHKRGSEDYAARRASQSDQLAAGGVVSGWFNKTFRGVQKPIEEQKKDSRRGVME